MQLRNSPPVHLTYCLNAHAGESWPDVLAAIQTHALPFRRRISPDRPFGLGLRLSHQAALELEQDKPLTDFLRFLDSNNLYVFTVNGFPYGTFHNARVKTSVYAPDWLTCERLDYTSRLARILARLLPDGLDGSISTVPLSYKAWINNEQQQKTMARRLVDLAVILADIRRKTGREIHVGLEPEPDCLLGTTGECISYFQNVLWPEGTAYAVTALGHSPDEAMAMLRSHIGVCLDTCHMAVEFHEPLTALRQFLKAGIRISKIQISAAMETAGTAEALSHLRDFCDPVYLHQTRIRTPNGMQYYPDLDVALDSQPPDPCSRWRIHFHVPLHMQNLTNLKTTAYLLDDAFWHQALNGCTHHFEVETYTYSVLPAHLLSHDTGTSIGQEFQWVLDRMQAHLLTTSP